MLRLTLGSTLAEAWGWGEIDEVKRSEWMHAHLRVIAIPVADADTLGRLKSAVLDETRPAAQPQQRSRRPTCDAGSPNCAGSTAGSGDVHVQPRNPHLRRAQGQAFGVTQRVSANRTVGEIGS